MPEALHWLTQSFNGVDAALLAVVGFSLLVGIVRGFTYELMALAGWVVAYFVALWYSPALTPHIDPYLPAVLAGKALGAAVALVLVFIATLIVWGLAARLVRLLVHATPLNLLDRLGGAIFGVLRGVVIVLIVAAVLPMTPWAHAPAWRDSALAGTVEGALAHLRPLWPTNPARARAGGPRE